MNVDPNLSQIKNPTSPQTPSTSGAGNSAPANVDVTQKKSAPAQDNYPGLGIERNADNPAEFRVIKESTGDEATTPNPDEPHVCPGDIEKMRNEHASVKEQLRAIDSEILKKEAAFAKLDRAHERGSSRVSEYAYRKAKEELGALYDKRDELRGRFEALSNNLNSGANVETSDNKTNSANNKASANISAKELAKKKEVREICDDIYKAIDGLGTDDKLFEKTLSRLNKDNIIEVMEHWQESYGNKYKETFFESFLGDADSKQKKEFGTKIIQLLEERADALGLDFTDKTTKMKAKLGGGSNALHIMAKIVPAAAAIEAGTRFSGYSKKDMLADLAEILKTIKTKE